MGLLTPKGRPLVNNPAIGDRTVAYIISRFVADGYIVLVPFGDRHRYDLVIEDAEENFWKVQCKTGRYRRGCVEFNCFSSSAYKGKDGYAVKHYKGQIHYFAVYCDHTKKCYLVPADTTGTGTVMLRIDPLPSRVNETRVRWAADYEL